MLVLLSLLNKVSLVKIISELAKSYLFPTQQRGEIELFLRNFGGSGGGDFVFGYRFLRLGWFWTSLLRSVRPYFPGQYRYCGRNIKKFCIHWSRVAGTHSCTRLLVVSKARALYMYELVRLPKETYDVHAYPGVSGCFKYSYITRRCVLVGYSEITRVLHVPVLFPTSSPAVVTRRRRGTL